MALWYLLLYTTHPQMLEIWGQWIFCFMGYSNSSQSAFRHGR
mgnify:CR=1 FL=1